MTNNDTETPVAEVESASDWYYPVPYGPLTEKDHRKLEYSFYDPSKHAEQMTAYYRGLTPSVPLRRREKLTLKESLRTVKSRIVGKVAVDAVFLAPPILESIWMSNLSGTLDPKVYAQYMALSFAAGSTGYISDKRSKIKVPETFKHPPGSKAQVHEP